MSELAPVAILDFGSQYTQLIARRIRELKVFSKIYPSDTSWKTLKQENVQGIILSGGPGSVSSDQLGFDSNILDQELPILGICFGMQLMNALSSGEVKKEPIGEYGKQKIICKSSPLFKNCPELEQVWMSHGESIAKLSPHFETIATSDGGLIAAIAHKEKNQFGLQFHPEVTHTEHGTELLSSFFGPLQLFT